MVAYQWMIEKQSKQQVSTVPNQDMLNGDFNFGGIGQAIYDPRTRRQLANGNWTADPFAGNIIPRSQWRKVAQNILGMNPYLLPNVPGSVTTTGPNEHHDRSDEDRALGQHVRPPGPAVHAQPQGLRHLDRQQPLGTAAALDQSPTPSSTPARTSPTPGNTWRRAPPGS